MHKARFHPIPPQAGLGKVALIGIIAGALLVLLVGGLLLARGGGNDEAAAEPLVEQPLQYFALEPAFIVNLADEGGTRYMQADVELTTRDPALLEQLKAHQPLIRNRLLLLFGDQRLAELRTRRDRERLQDEALAEVRAVLEHAGVQGELVAVYFTSFVTQ